MADIESYKVDISESQLVELKQRLSLTRFPRELEDAKWDLGSPLADIKRLATYWANGFDWRKTEAKINELPQFRTTIQVPGFEPLRIHFVHQKSGVKEAIPLLFVHGCEFMLLTRDSNLTRHAKGLAVFWRLESYFLSSAKVTARKRLPFML